MAKTSSSSIWRHSAIAVAVGLCVASGATYAQSNTTGDIFGQVAAPQGVTIVVESLSTGVKRTITPDASGRFIANSLPPGNYKITQMLNGAAVGTLTNIEVSVGKAREVAFAAGGSQVVQVTGKLARIDVASSDNSTVFTSKQLDAIPLANKDINGIVGLAANTVKADARYAGGVSIGGGGPSENAYYINGFPVTNALTQLGSIELPFGAIQQAQVLTGGYGSEFGRSVGGVVNVITKSGSNEWHGGLSASTEPNSLRSTPKSIYYPQTGAYPTTDGTIYFDRSGNTRSETTMGGYIGGPIIQDKLFFFFAADQTSSKTAVINSTPQGSGLGQTGWLASENKNDRYLGKFDWYLNEDNRLELTLLGDNYKTTDNYSGYSYATGAPTTYTYSEYTKNLGGTTPGVGGDAQILKYSSNLTPDLLLSVLYGQSESTHTQSFNFKPTLPTVFYNTTNRAIDPRILNGGPGPTPGNPLPGGTTGIPDGAKDNTKSLRFDLEYRVGDHLVRLGVDENRLKSRNAGESRVGGSYWRYSRIAQLDSKGVDNGTKTNLLGGQTQSLNAAGATAVGGYYYGAQQLIFNDATNADSNQSAQYIEDRWQVTKDLLVTGGLRNESFANKNGDGETFLKVKNFLSPRLAASWNVNGDSSLKVYGSAGRYSLQIPTHVAVRGASRSLNTAQFFAYTGIDPTSGAPSGLTAVTTPFSANNEYNQAKDPRSVADQNIKPTYQDEMTLGIEKALTSDLIGGVKVTYRTLKATIDDFCDYRPIDAYAAANKIAITNPVYPFGCATINPGSPATLYLDVAGDGKVTQFNLSAADIGLPKPKRTYLAIDLSLEHPFKDNWYGKVTYTYAKSKGNTEGQTKSDNAQTDVAVTSTWDFPELMEGSYGYLPNDRTHSIKTYGYYQMTPELAVGASLLLESGRPKNCFGDYGGTGTDIGGTQYGGVFFYCGGKLSPRGSAGRLPWQQTLDMNVVYKPEGIKGLGLRVDVLNVLNTQTTQVVDEQHDSAYNFNGLNPGYGRTISYTAPRTVRFTAQYDF